MRQGVLCEVTYVVGQPAAPVLESVSGDFGAGVLPKPVVKYTKDHIKNAVGDGGNLEETRGYKYGDFQ